MAFSKQAKRENNLMRKEAAAVLTRIGYSPENTDPGYVAACINWATARLRPQFPNVPDDRIKAQVARAKSAIYTRWVRERNQ